MGFSFYNSMKGGFSYITEATFKEYYQNLPMVTVHSLIENPNLHTFIFSYFKLREHYSFKAGRILRSEIDIVGNVIGKKRSATFIHLNKLVELGYLRKMEYGWQLVSVYKTNDELKEKYTALLSRLNNKDVRTWTLNQFKAHITWLHHMYWSNRKYHKEFLKDNDIAYVHEGKYYKADHTRVSKKKMIVNTSAYLKGRDLSLSLVAVMSKCHKSTARRRILDCPEIEKRYVISKREFIAVNKTCMLFDQVDQLNTTHQKKGRSYSPNKGVEKRTGKYFIGSGCKIYFQPVTKLIYHEGLITKNTIRKEPSKKNPLYIYNNIYSNSK